jgi:predicted metal-dependent hydrolase
MIAAIQLGDVSVDLVFKDIKNLHLSVYPPTGRVRVSAPSRMNIETIRAFLISKLGWIRQHQVKFGLQERETPREYLDRESHYLWGRRLLLDINLSEDKPYVELGHKKLHVGATVDTSHAELAELVDEFYRKELRKAAEALRIKWQKIIDVEINQIFIQRMKTQWGSCNTAKRNIRLNLELAKKPEACLEYIFVHEIIHFFEPTHGKNFISLMDKHLFNWRLIRQQLNEEPLSHTEWKY